MLDRQHIRNLVDEAATATEGLDEPLRTAAFQTVLGWLLSEAPGSTSPTAGSPNVASTPSSPVAPALSVNEFIASVSIRSHTDRIIAILYYNLRHRANDRMTREELLDTYARLRERRPANISDLIAKNIRKGYVIDSPEDKDGRHAWQITPAGERYIEAMQEGE